ncbi:MAG TPA: AAA family ATPase [Saprospiraceae bacterium]|nr:AAA family ATPase [Saprospiraceae bacterium]
MRIKKLELQNYRGFKNASVAFSNDNIAVLFGWNGSGKTSVLDAIATLVSGIPFPKKSFLGITKSDYDYNILEDADILVGQNEAKITAEVENLDESLILEESIRRGNQAVFTNSFIPKSIKLEDVLPVVAYYRTNREIPSIKNDEYPNNLRSLFNSRTYAYATSINAKAGTFFDFTEWWRYEEDIENQQKIDKKDFSWERPTLHAIRQGITKFLTQMGLNFSELRIKRQGTSEIDFAKPSVKAELHILKGDTELKLSQLSAGERSILLLVADIARRAAILNTGFINPLESPGIVLIDEIELHLHPKWQRAVIGALRNTFPNIQFIVATHSPQVLGGVENGNVFEIEDFQIRVRNTFGKDNNWLLHVIMDDEIRDKKVQKDLARYIEFIRQGDLDKADTLREELVEMIGSDDPELVKADILIQKKSAKTR